MTRHTEDNGRRHITPHSWQDKTMLGYALGDHPSEDTPGQADEPGPGHGGGAPAVQARTWYLIGAVELIVVGLVVALVVSGG